MPISEENYLLLAHRFAVDIAIREYGYPGRIHEPEEDFAEFYSLINILETAGKTIHFRQPARIFYTDGSGRHSVTLAPLGLTRIAPQERWTDRTFPPAKTIHLTGISIDSTRSSRIYLETLDKTGRCSINFFEKDTDLVTVPVRAIESIKPVYTGKSPSDRAVFTAEKAERCVCIDNDDGDLLNLCGRPFEIDIFDSLLDAERLFSSVNDWMVGFDDETSEEKIISWLRKNGQLEEDEYGYRIPFGLEDFFINPERTVQCINYLKLTELFLHFDLEPNAESLPEFLKQSLKNKALRYLRKNEPCTTTDYQCLLTESEVRLPISDRLSQTHLTDCFLESFREVKEIDFIGNTLGYRDTYCLRRCGLNLIFDGIDINPQGEKSLIPVYTVVETSSDEYAALVPLAINTDDHDSIVLTCLNANRLVAERSEGKEQSDSIYLRIIQAVNGIISSSDLESLLYTIPIKDALSQTAEHCRCRSAEIKEQLRQAVFAFKERCGIFCDPLFDSLIQQKRCYRVVLRSGRTDSTSILFPDCFEILPENRKGKNDLTSSSATGLSDELLFETCEHRLVIEFLQKYAGVIEISKDDIKTGAALRRLIQRQYRLIME